MAIQSTMIRKKGSVPGKFSYQVPGSRNVIITSVSKKAVQHDSFVKHKSKCPGIQGSPKSAD